MMGPQPLGPTDKLQGGKLALLFVRFVRATIEVTIPEAGNFDDFNV